MSLNARSHSKWRRPLADQRFERGSGLASYHHSEWIWLFEAVSSRCVSLALTTHPSEPVSSRHSFEAIAPHLAKLATLKHLTLGKLDYGHSPYEWQKLPTFALKDLKFRGGWQDIPVARLRWLCAASTTSLERLELSDGCNTSLLEYIHSDLKKLTHLKLVLYQVDDHTDFFELVMDIARRPTLRRLSLQWYNRSEDDHRAWLRFERDKAALHAALGRDVIECEINGWSRLARA